MRGDGRTDGGARVAGRRGHENLVEQALADDLANGDTVHRDATTRAQQPRAGDLAGPPGQVEHHLLGAFLQRRGDVGVDLGHVFTGPARWASRLSESGGDPWPAVPQDPQWQQFRVQREPGPGEPDRPGEDTAEPGRVAERGQGHHCAFLVAAPPAKVLGDRPVGIAEGGRIADGLGHPVTDPAAFGTGVAEGCRAGLAEAVGDQDGRLLIPGSRERVQAMGQVMAEAADRGIRERLLQRAHSLPIPAMDDREARRPCQRPVPGGRLQ